MSCLLDAPFNSHICATAPTVMATAVSLDRSIALSVSADHLVGRYNLDKVRARLTSHLNCDQKREPNKRTPGGSNFELGDHRNGVPNKAPRKWRGGVPRRWTGMCHWRLGRSVRSPLTFFMIGFSTDDRTSSFEKNPVTMKKNFDAKNKY